MAAPCRPPFEYRLTRINPNLWTESGDPLQALRLREDTTWQWQRSNSSEAVGPVATENAFVAVARCFLLEANVTSLVIRGLGHSARRFPAFAEGETIVVDQLRQLIPVLLHGDVWCGLETDMAYIHVENRFAMYIGLPIEANLGKRMASALGVFVSSARSPYLFRA